MKPITHTASLTRSVGAPCLNAVSYHPAYGVFPFRLSETPELKEGLDAGWVTG